MTNLGFIIYFIFIIFIIIAIILKKKPIMIGAVGLLAVGIAEKLDFFNGVQVVFRSLLSTSIDLMPIILLIGLVVAMTSMLRETGTDRVIIKPFLKLKRAPAIYWILGISLWILSLFLWPTPAVTLLGALILPIVNNTKINPIALAVGLCIFGEGIGLAGDYIIQGAPGLLAKSAGLPIEQVIEQSVPLVFGSGLLAALIGYWKLLSLNNSIRGEQSILDKEEVIRSNINEKKKKILAIITGAIFFIALAWLLLSGLRGDSAAAATGGITVIVLILGTLLSDYHTSLNSFVQYIQKGMRFSMEVFAPIVVIAGFFLLGTQQGNEHILFKSGPGYLEQLAMYLADRITLNEITCSVIVVLAAILGAMSGSGFSALPLVGGIAAALGQASGISIVHLAVLGQVTAIWTDATIIPWGFPAVVSAVTKTESVTLVRHNTLPWLAAICFSFLWTIITFPR